MIWPAVDEAYCMALVEAQAAGLPVVAGARPGIAAVVDDGRTGLLTPVGDVDAFADAVRSLLDDRSRREAMADAAAQSAVRFDLSMAARRLDDVLTAACLRP
jgi:glycosyltransferase involved in cell wall biosynthesis